MNIEIKRQIYTQHVQAHKKKQLYGNDLIQYIKAEAFNQVLTRQ